jgi:phage tail sheath protein FI
MPEYLAPGVYIEEFESRPKPIEGVSTSTAGMAGHTERGPFEPRLVTSWVDYQHWFGGAVSDSYLPLAIQGFFENGGQRVFVARATGAVTSVADVANALTALEAITEISLLVVPDEVRDSTGQISSAVISQCERLENRFAIVSAPGNRADISSIHPPRDTSYAAYYYPWIRVAAPAVPAGDAKQAVLVPPGGHVAGIYARTDVERGVHKAPANEVVHGVVAADPLEFFMSKSQQDVLNPRGVNVIRDFRPEGRGVRVWGARTMSSNAELRYVPVRRLLIFIEESIAHGTRWVNVEPNTETTWALMRHAVTDFLRRVWLNGALVGIKDDEAYFVKCDRTTMTQDDIDNGRLICLIGIAPVRPAEFVILRISQVTAEHGTSDP